MGSHEINKGKRFERAVARWLNRLALGSAEWKRRTDEPQGGLLGDVVDVMETNLINHQGKHQKRPSVWKALQEAKKAAMASAGDENLGVAVVRRHGGEDLVAMTPGLYGALLLTLTYPECEFEAALEYMATKEGL